MGSSERQPGNKAAVRSAASCTEINNIESHTVLQVATPIPSKLARGNVSRIDGNPLHKLAQTVFTHGKLGVAQNTTGIPVFQNMVLSRYLCLPY